ncbi:Peptidyl-prolyl cis-trans isomerase PpiD [hydrothermal vent metagenome]|jgi:peptidyl-prolyl cis-trans isomerase D|uniref:Periplasmic chaperone PpiD n=1 Tax=hydrothermal vent metagenome TaxID=652676 RepID=A0A160TT65_9ZZZZ
MLITIRERASGVIGWTVAGVIILVFAVWGIGSYFEGVSEIIVATADKIEINQQTYQQAMSDRRRRLVQMMGRNVDAELFSSTAFKRQVVEELIDTTLQNETLHASGFRISDAQLAALIQNTAVFHTDGQFDRDRYELLVQNSGMTIQGYESYQRQQGVVDQLVRGLGQSAIVSTNSIDKAWKLLDQRRIASYTTLEFDNFLDDIQVSETAIEKEYQANLDGYFEPASIQVDYLKLSVEDLGTRLDVDEADILRMYEDNPDRYRQPGSRSASHILLSVSPDAADAQIDQVRQRASEIVARARGGESFASLAEVNSDDKGSAKRGGELGVIRPGTMVKPFEDSVFVMGEGEISEPVRTQYGFHVIRLDRITESRVQSLDQVRSEIEIEVRRLRAEERFNELAEILGSTVFEQPDSLEPAADHLGVKVMRSEWFTQDAGTGIAEFQVVRDAAFGNEVLIDGLNSELIEIDQDNLVAVRKVDYRARRQLDLNEARPGLEKRLRAVEASDKMEKAGEDLVARLKSGADWDELLIAHKLARVRLPETTETLLEPLEQVVARVVYAALVPLSGQIAYGGERISPARYAIYRLERVEFGDPASASEEDRLGVEKILSSRRGGEMVIGWRQGLRKVAKVQINEELL